MIYQNIISGRFSDRPNRFIAHVWVNGQLETVHVKNTGRCRELLVPGAEVMLTAADDPKRKTKYDLISVKKPELGWVNIDSQAPNRVAREWLMTQNYTAVRPEYTFGDSRIDFYMERGAERFLMEVKGCTLEEGGIGYFPDAPTERGVKHLRELAKAAGNGWHCMLAFVIQMEGIREVRPNTTTHAEFGTALEEAKKAGVEILFLHCHVTETELVVMGHSALERMKCVT